MYLLKFLCFILFLTSCSSPLNEQGNLSGTVEDVIIEQVVKNSHWCTFNKIIFKIVLNNNSNNDFKINNKNYIIDYCNIEKEKPLLLFIIEDKHERYGKIPLYNDTIGLKIETKKDEIIIRKKSKLELNCLLLMNLYGNSLQRNKELYQRLFDSKFKILFPLNEKNDTLIFTKSNLFKINYILDDENVLSSDSIKMNFNNDPPWPATSQE
ncbi:MAG: hypothetical protein IPI52_15860 [Bacteroidetes bacterium]|nr:hypothetical protein [Bacteroidota bacterium]